MTDVLDDAHLLLWIIWILLHEDGCQSIWAGVYVYPGSFGWVVVAHDFACNFGLEQVQRFLMLLVPLILGFGLEKLSERMNGRGKILDEPVQ